MSSYCLKGGKETYLFLDVLTHFYNIHLDLLYVGSQDGMM